jgi:chromosome segregation ATPase
VSWGAEGQTNPMQRNTHFRVSQDAFVEKIKGEYADCATNSRMVGVMRFLQTEWHRHERDRNAWEIERQEMKGRIANLEGATRRADATQKALKKYVSILEKKIKEQSSQLTKASGSADDKAGDGSAEVHAERSKADRAALIQEKLQGTLMLQCLGLVVMTDDPVL